jgi:hypothetical protein
MHIINTIYDASVLYGIQRTLAQAVEPRMRAAPCILRL